MSRLSKTHIDIQPQQQQISLKPEEIKQKVIHLKTILMLTELNSTYFQLQITFNKVFKNLQKKYYKQKLKGFNVLKNWHLKKQALNIFLKSKTVQQKKTQKFELFRNNTKISYMQKEKQLTLITYKNIKCKLQKLLEIVNSKYKNYLQLNFIEIFQFKRQKNKYSQKESKKQTNDTNKPKIIYSRNIIRTRLSHSMQKQKQQIYQEKNIAQNNKNKSYFVYNRQLDKNIQFRGRSQTENNQKFITRGSFKIQNSQYINKQTRIRKQQLKKYKQKYYKLIIQFNQFSLKFQNILESSDSQKQ